MEPQLHTDAGTIRIETVMPGGWRLNGVPLLAASAFAAYRVFVLAGQITPESGFTGAAVLCLLGTLALTGGMAGAIRVSGRKKIIIGREQGNIAEVHTCGPLSVTMSKTPLAKIAAVRAVRRADKRGGYDVELLNGERAKILAAGTFSQHADAVAFARQAASWLSLPCEDHTAQVHT